MASSLISKVLLFNKDYYKLTTNIFQDYTYTDFEDSIFWKAIYVNFKYQTKENQEVINGKTGGIIKKCCIFCSIRINHHENNGTQLKILIKLMSTIKYDISLKDQDMNCIKQVEKLYNKVLRGIQY